MSSPSTYNCWCQHGSVCFECAGIVMHCMGHGKCQNSADSSHHHEHEHRHGVQHVLLLRSLRALQRRRQRFRFVMFGVMFILIVQVKLIFFSAISVGIFRCFTYSLHNQSIDHTKGQLLLHANVHFAFESNHPWRKQTTLSVTLGGNWKVKSDLLFL